MQRSNYSAIARATQLGAQIQSDRLVLLFFLRICDSCDVDSLLYTCKWPLITFSFQIAGSDVLFLW